MVFEGTTMAMAKPIHIHMQLLYPLLLLVIRCDPYDQPLCGYGHNINLYMINIDYPLVN